MKISAKKYAEALLSSLEGKNEKQSIEQIENLLRIMQKNGDMKKSSQVIKYFGEFWDLLNKVSKVDVTTAVPMDKATEKHVKDFVVEKFQVEKVEMNVRLDKNILGGVVVRGGDRIFDGSLSRRLFELRERLVN